MKVAQKFKYFQSFYFILFFKLNGSHRQCEQKCGEKNFKENIYTSNFPICVIRHSGNIIILSMGSEFRFYHCGVKIRTFRSVELNKLHKHFEKSIKFNSKSVHK